MTPDEQKAVLPEFRLPIYVVEDDGDLRQSLSFELRSAGYTVYTFGSAESFLGGVRTAEVYGCLVCDVRLPGMGGVELIEQLVRVGSKFRIIVMTAFGDTGLAVRAMRAGAFDVLEKPFEANIVIAAVKGALADVPPLPASRAAAAAASAQLANLTIRERQVFDLIVSGQLSKQIGGTLGISPRTVETHRANLMLHLGVRTLPEMMRIALSVG